MADGFDPQVYAAMQENKSYKKYKKTILGKVYVIVLDPFSGQPFGFLLSGDPKRDDVSISVFSEKEDLFFKRMNKRHLELGYLIVAEDKVEKPKEKKLEEFSDEELKGVLNSKFFTLSNLINKTESEIVLTRMVDLAIDMEKSERLVNALKARLAEVQEVAFSNKVVIEK